MESLDPLKIFTEYYFSQGILGVTAMLFLVLYLGQMRSRGKDRAVFDKDVKILWESRLSERTILTDAVREFSSTSEVLLADRAILKTEIADLILSVRVLKAILEKEQA